MREVKITPAAKLFLGSFCSGERTDLCFRVLTKVVLDIRLFLLNMLHLYIGDIPKLS